MVACVEETLFGAGVCCSGKGLVGARYGRRDLVLVIC